MINLVYNEIKKKNGQLLIFCNFENLLMEAFDLPSIDSIEEQRNSNGEFICHCPFCREEGHTKHKLYIKGDLTVGHCFVCTRSFINVTDSVDVSYSAPEFTTFNFTPERLEVVKLEDPVWTLDKYFNEFDTFDEVGVKYLNGRHGYMNELYEILDFKFMDGNIVMPFKYKGEIFYYQVRFSGNSRIKYYFPPISAKPPYIIEHGDNKKLIICEGIFDAIALLIQAPEYTPVAVLGSSISDYQLEFLREYIPDEIVIYMDETRISKTIAQKIMTKIDYCPIRIIYSDGQDPEEKLCELLKRNSANLQWIKSKVKKYDGC